MRAHGTIIMTLLIGWLAMLAAHAQSYPTRPVTLTHGSAAGLLIGSCRTHAQQSEPTLGDT
jgi:hypothetical protein